MVNGLFRLKGMVMEKKGEAACVHILEGKKPLCVHEVARDYPTVKVNQAVSVLFINNNNKHNEIQG